MKKFLKRLTILFSAGCLGGLLNSLVIWFFGAKEITAALSVKIAPQLTGAWLCPRIVWGGIWGFLFLLPLSLKSVVFRGFLYSLGPTITQLFILFPAEASKGMMGLKLGDMTPAFVLFFNAVWGISTALWVKLAEE
jgi:hypothetical protein